MSATEQTPDPADYETWYSALAGDPHGWHEGELYAGYWRTEWKKEREDELTIKHMTPVAVWRDTSTGKFVMQEGHEMVGENRAMEVMGRCKAITHEAYLELLETFDQPTDRDDPIYASISDLSKDQIAERAKQLLTTDLRTAARMADAVHMARQLEKAAKAMLMEELSAIDLRKKEIQKGFELATGNASTAKHTLTGRAKTMMEEQGLEQLRGDMKTIALGTTKKAEIHSLERLLNMMVREYPAALEPCAQKFANAMMRKGEELPGVDIKDVRSVK